MLADSHAHLDDGRFAPDLTAVLDRAREAGVQRIVTVGTGLASCEAAIALAQRNPEFVCASVGIHPHDAAGADEAALARLAELARSPGVVAIGETGLDYHYDRSPRDVQRAVFESQIRIALQLNLPVVIHCREAYADCLAVLKEHAGDGLRGVLHCFAGDRATAEALIGMGFFISFAGPLTFPSAGNLREIGRLAPMEQLLIETDCPYLAPQPVRGRRNEPAFVRYVAEALAALRGMTADEVAARTAANAIRLFGPAERGF
ncbi:MAG: TatD family hydrolase [Candidatus Brocadiia bacterium]|jgi:TatD DNase family protein